MSRAGDTALELGGEERVFRLAIGQWRNIQEKCDAGPAEILARLAPAFNAARQGFTAQQIIAAGYLGTWRIDDIREVIFQGLLGAGASAKEAVDLVRTWVEDRPFIESLPVAYEIVLASVIGAEDEKAVGESPAPGEGSPASSGASSGSGKTASTPSARRRGSRPPKSTT